MTTSDKVDILPPRPGDIWRDLDPRGGPTFRVLAISETDRPRVSVVGLDGKRPRWLLLNRFRSHPLYRSGYFLLERDGDR